MSRPARAALALAVAFLVSCLGFVYPSLHWFLYLPGIFAKRLMILIGFVKGIDPWLALALEFGFNLLVFAALAWLAMAPLGKRGAGAV